MHSKLKEAINVLLLTLRVSETAHTYLHIKFVQLFSNNGQQQKWKKNDFNYILEFTSSHVYLNQKHFSNYIFPIINYCCSKYNVSGEHSYIVNFQMGMGLLIVPPAPKISPMILEISQ